MVEGIHEEVLLRRNVRLVGPHPVRGRGSILERNFVGTLHDRLSVLAAIEAAHDAQDSFAGPLVLFVLATF